MEIKYTHDKAVCDVDDQSSAGSLRCVPSTLHQCCWVVVTDGCPACKRRPMTQARVAALTVQTGRLLALAREIRMALSFTVAEPEYDERAAAERCGRAESAAAEKG